MDKTLHGSEIGDTLQKMEPGLVNKLNKSERQKLSKALLRIEQGMTVSVTQSTATSHSGSQHLIAV